MDLTRKIDVLDKGFVAITDVMGDDTLPARVARTSFNNVDRPRSVEADRKLVRYLLRHKHTTPLEFCQIRYYMKLPIFVARQIIRHRTASVNEISFRYVQASRDFYVPQESFMLTQSEINKQGSSEISVSDPAKCQEIITQISNQAFDAYERLVNEGLALERARIVLPVNTYTEWYWQIDLHNLLHFLRLRLDKHAQLEAREYAQAMLELIKPIFPTATENFQ
jgi:thymidylate synthase (FAD)